MRSENELLLSEMRVKIGATDFVSEIKHKERHPDFEKLAY